MMKKVDFTKIVASGNDFIILKEDSLERKRLKELARRICDRKYGIGADGLLLLEKSKIAHIKMRIFNSDGSEAEMCGNGARCVAYWVNSLDKSFKHRLRAKGSKTINIETKAGIIESQVNGNKTKVKLTSPKEIKLDIPLVINKRKIRVNFVNTGVPHTVIFVAGIDKINVKYIGRIVRFHKRFYPQGTNVNFVEVKNSNEVKIRTYERGVEDETLSCGTGIVASAFIFALKSNFINKKITVWTRSGERLMVDFRLNKTGYEPWLEGPVRVICRGECYV
jgi:diaminopimelate epimerase